MRWVPCFVLLLAAALPCRAAEASHRERLLEDALALAQTVEDRAERADAIGRVAAEIAASDPRRALSLVSGEMATHEQSEAMARVAEAFARDNRYLGLATLIRIGDRSTVLTALTRIIAMEALTDLGEAVDLVEQIDTLPVRRMVEREVSRALWTDFPDSGAAGVQVAAKWAEGITDPVTRNEAQAYAAEGMAGYDLTAACEMVASLPAGDARDLGWRLVTERIADAHPAAAADLLGRLETPLQRGLAAISVVRALGRSDDVEPALALARATRASVTTDLEDPRDQGLILGELALTTVDLDAAQALSLLSQVWPPERRYVVQCLVARSRALEPQVQRELLDDAWVEVRRQDSPLTRRRIAAAALATASEVAPDLLDEFEAARPDLVQQALPDAVEIASPRSPQFGLQLAERIADRRAQEAAKAGIAAAIAPSQPDLALRITDQLSLPGARSAALVALASAAVD